MHSGGSAERCVNGAGGGGRGVEALEASAHQHDTNRLLMKTITINTKLSILHDSIRFHCKRLPPRCLIKRGELVTPQP